MWSSSKLIGCRKSPLPCSHVAEAPIILLSAGDCFEHLEAALGPSKGIAPHCSLLSSRPLGALNSPTSGRAWTLSESGWLDEATQDNLSFD